VSLIVAPKGPSLSELPGCIKIVGPAVDMGNSLSKGEPMGALVGLVGVGLDTLAVLADPIAALASSVANIMLTYMPPLPQMLDALVGNPDAVKAMSETWTNIGKAVDASTREFEAEVDALMAKWHGHAATAYKNMAKGVATVSNGVVAASNGVAAGLDIASQIIEVVQGIVKTIISDLVGTLISMLVETLATAGVGAAVAVPQGITKICQYAERVKKWTSSLKDGMGGMVKAIEEADKIFKDVSGPMKNIADVLTKSSVVLPVVKKATEILAG
jgi:uncharacterized protein YukE